MGRDIYKNSRNLVQNIDGLLRRRLLIDALIRRRHFGSSVLLMVLGAKEMDRNKKKQGKTLAAITTQINRWVALQLKDENGTK